MKLNPIPRIKSFINDSKRIFGVSYKPNMDAFKRTLKIILIGILILGVMSYVISSILGFVISI
jgi:protein translocase SEC61 complex gamma subunit